MPDEIKREKMYGWYDPGHLLETGIRVGIATIFGEFLDRRELFSDRSKPLEEFDKAFDYSKDENDAPRTEIWFDYAADTGDGWDPTFAIARLLARERLDFEQSTGGWAGLPKENTSQTREETQRGEILIFGGDEVYSTASRELYETRFERPFEEGAKAEGTAAALNKADVYALPGNHDWYDGLNAFVGLFLARRPDKKGEGFGSGRLIACRRTKQTRSYFALKLPGDWWLIGVDAQLSGYIDQGQISFLDDIAQRHMLDGSNIILCAATPSWSYVHLDGSPKKMFSNHGFVENVITGRVHENDKTKKARRHNLRLVLTGDSHHYTRYMEGVSEANKRGSDVPADARCYLTWGGAGTFMHPTHQLKSVDFEWEFPPPRPVQQDPVKGRKLPYERSFKKAITYPAADESKRLSWRVLLFPTNNPRFAALMFAFSVVVTWALAGTASLKEHLLPKALRETGGFFAAMQELGLLLVSFPWILLTCIALAAALAYFSGAETLTRRWIFGSLHFVAHFVSYFVVFVALSLWIELENCPWLEPVALVVLVSLIMAFVTPFILGAYLLLSLNRYRIHWNEAFSSLRIKDYKGFLRLHIKDGLLTVYPIAMDSVPAGGEGELVTKLIERPIRIRSEPPPVREEDPPPKPKRKPRASKKANPDV